MTRINVIPVEELSDQHLIAEYHELPRVIKQKVNIENASDFYVLGAGHVKWAKKHSRWLMRRYLDITWELQFRGFNTKYPFYKLYEKYETEYYTKECDNFYKVSKHDIEINQTRLIEKYNLKPNYYKWTNRNKPEYYHDI